MKANVAKIMGLAGVMSLLVASSAFATAPYDLSPVTTDIVSQIQAVLTDVLPIAGGILALFVGWRLVKRFVKA
jgi:uncharacterized membrane protein YozB (DUF420 family)